MDILFIHSIDDAFLPDKPLRTPEQMQFGISYISSLLKAHGHRTKLVVLSRILGKKNKATLDRYLKEFSPKLICFNAVSSEYGFIVSIAKYIKNKYPDIYLLIGGPHVSLNPDGVLSEPFDALCIGEGENPTLELTSQLEKNISPSEIPNLWIKQGLQIKKNPPRPFLKELDNLPFPDREMWQEWIEEEPGSRYPVLLGRGCPFQCTYCCNHALRGIAEGPYVRLRSPDNIISEIKELIKKFPLKRDIYLEVETITANTGWAMELCRKLELFNSTLRDPLSFGVNLRITPNMDFAPLFLAFKKSNFKVINIGVESGSERVRREILNRDYSNQDIINTVNLARKHGLKIHFYNLIGIPGETRNDFFQTVDINCLCLPDRIYTHIFFPYPGTKLYETCREQGLLKDGIDTDLERCKAVLGSPGFSKKQIQKSFIWFDYYVYKGHKPLNKIMAKVLVSKLRSHSFLRYFYRQLSCLSFLRRFRNTLSRAISK